MPSARTAAGAAGMIQLSAEEQDAWDAPLIALTQKSGDLKRLMYAFFSFLNRRTDFYMVAPDDAPSNMGFKEGDAEKLLLAAFRQFPLRKMPSAAVMAQQKQRHQQQQQQKKQAQAKEKKAVLDAKKLEAKAEPSQQISEKPEENGPADDSKAASSTDQKSGSAFNLMAGVRYSEDKKQCPVDNGGSTRKYQWTQSLYEASVIVPLPVRQGTVVKAKDLSVSLRFKELSIAFKDPNKFKDSLLVSEDANEIILKGDFTEAIRPDDSTWTIETSSNDGDKATPTMLLVLDKAKKMWWKSILQGDDEIDTELVDSTRKVGEYDESTQGAIRKIIFDQQQQQRGLPSSDQILAKEGKGVYSMPHGREVTMDLPTGIEFIDSETLKKAAASKDIKTDKS
jgi:hypothetical protein